MALTLVCWFLLTCSTVAGNTYPARQGPVCGLLLGAYHPIAMRGCAALHSEGVSIRSEEVCTEALCWLWLTLLGWAKNVTV
jgi:hypothetical protein